MKISLSRFALRQTILLGAVACALLGAGRASADPYTYEVDNYTFSGGDPVHPVTDDLTFNNLLITETYSDGFMQSTALGSLNTSDIRLFSPATLGAPGHGLLSTAILTGQLGRDGFPATSFLDISTQFAPGGPITDQYVFSNFSTSLFGPATSGVSAGQFTLLDENNNPVSGPAEITLTPVPEATSAASLGMLVLLGLGTLAVSRRRAASAH